MRKATFLLGALALVSSVAYAKEVVPAVEEVVIAEETVKEQPKLVVTHIGQEIEIENQSGADDFDDVWLFNTVGMKYNDWTFGLKAGKQWNVDFDNGIHSDTHRLELDAWKKVSDNLKLGARYRGQKDRDRIVVRYDYNNGFLWSAGDFWYQSNNNEVGRPNGTADNYEMEWFPIGFQYGPFKAGYFVNGILYVGDNGEGQQNYYLEHQIRSYLSLYKGEKLSVNAEYRITLHHENDYEDKEGGVKKDYRVYDDFGRHRIYLGASYQVNENLNIYGKYGYEFRDWSYENTTEKKWLANKDNHSLDNYQNIIVGWKYTF